MSFFFLFQNCLGIIYTVFIESVPVPLENIVSNILGCIQVPPPGGPQVRFSIGAGDRQALQPPLSPSLPVTHTTVHLLFQQLGKSHSDYSKQHSVLYLGYFIRNHSFSSSIKSFLPLYFSHNKIFLIVV